jgi:TatA/E family protein of Tat protein translocase
MSPVHRLVVLIIVMFLFRTKRLLNVGSDFGAALRGFRERGRSADEERLPRWRRTRTGAQHHLAGRQAAHHA